MGTITRFEEIQAWQTARELTQQIYQFSEEGRFARDFGLKDQIRRAAVSTMSNIAEGFESRTHNQFLNYLGQSKASAGEMRSQLYVALDLQYLDPAQFAKLYDLADKASRQISRFMNYLETNPSKRQLREDQTEYHIE